MMSFIQVGELVRVYHEDDFFDEGEVKSIVNGRVRVDFYDWETEWNESDLRLRELFYEGIEVLIPINDGVIVADYRLRSDGKARVDEW